MKLHPLFFLMMSLSIFSYIGSISVKAEKIKLDNIISHSREKYNEKTQHIKAETSRDLKLEAAIRRELGKFDRVVRYSYNRVDLNGDKKPEVLVGLSGSLVCGNGGCMVYIFQSTGKDYRMVSSIGSTSVPIIVTNQKTNGWNDLIVDTFGNYRRQNGQDGYWQLKFNGKKYPGEPEEGVHLNSNAKITGKAYFDQQNDTQIELQP